MKMMVPSRPANGTDMGVLDFLTRTFFTNGVDAALKLESLLIPVFK